MARNRTMLPVFIFEDLMMYNFAQGELIILDKRFNTNECNQY